MASGYKVRLPDGSEIGPLSLEELKDWLARGLIGRDSPVLRPNGSRWLPLREVIKVQGPAPQRATGGAGPSPELLAAVRAISTGPGRAQAQGRRSEPAGAAAPPPTPRWRLVLITLLSFAGAAGALFGLLWPERWHPALDGAPWRELALGQLALGLLLVMGWELGRRLARVLLTAAALALFPVAGVLFAQRVPREALGVVACTFVLLLGLVLLLARGWLPAWQVGLRLLLVLGAGYGIARLGLVAERADAAHIREAARPDRSLHDAAHGARLALRAGWVALQPTQTLVPALPGSWAVLAETRLGGRARVVLEAARVPLSADVLLTRALEARHLEGRVELERDDAPLGALRARRARSRFVLGGQPQLDLTLAARDGDFSWTFSAWIPDDGSSRPAHELDELAAGFALDGRAAARRAALLTRLTEELPFLDRAASELVVAGTSAADQASPRVLRRGLELASRGRASLAVAEAEELDNLTTAAIRLLPKAERQHVASYLARVQAGEATEPVDDEVVAPLLKRALLSLPDQSLARLQALYEKAIRTGLEAGSLG